MDLQQLEIWRKRAGLVSGLLFIFCLLCLADGLRSHFGGDFNRIEALAGESLSLGERMPPFAESLDDLRYESGSELLRLTFKSTNVGFWLGGKMWTATAHLDPALPPGEYTLRVLAKDASEPSRPAVFSLKVYPDAAALKAASGSIVTRNLGISPFLLSAAFFVLALGSGLAGYLLAGSIDALLARSGLAEIYQCKSTPEGQVIGFSLGQTHGLSPNSRILILDPQGMQVGEAVVNSLRQSSATALVVQGQNIAPGLTAKLAAKEL